jgi:hypothetical protein
MFVSRSAGGADVVPSRPLVIPYAGVTPTMRYLVGLKPIRGYPGSIYGAGGE